MNDTMKEKLQGMFMDPKIWISLAVTIFTAGGISASMQESRATHDDISSQTLTIMKEHQVTVKELVEKWKNDSTENGLQIRELVRVSKNNCLNTAKDDISRRACL